MEQQKFWSLIASLGFQEYNPVSLLPAWGNQACRQWELKDLIADLCFQGQSLVALLPVQGERSLQAAETLRPDCHTGFREHNTVAGLGKLSLLAGTFWYPWSCGRCGSCLHRGAGFPCISG
jgi:hypothetical protein